jgi:mRNA-degrading endonuclease toxin of MazEF toxin-antitoxin module
MNRPFPRRGEIWSAQLGTPPVRHWVVIVSLDARNSSDRIDSVLVVPFGSGGFEGPTAMRLEAGESGLPQASYLKAHFITTLSKARLVAREARSLSETRMREVVTLIRRAVDPAAPYERRANHQWLRGSSRGPSAEMKAVCIPFQAPSQQRTLRGMRICTN